MEGDVRRDFRNAGQIGDTVRQGNAEGHTGVLGDIRQIDGADAQGIPQILQGRLAAGYPDGLRAELNGGIVCIRAAAGNQVVGQAQILDPPDGHVQPYLFHIGGDESGIHRVAVFIAERVGVAFADGLPPPVQIHRNGGTVNGIDHGLGARHRDLGIIQGLVLPVDHEALGGGAYPGDLNGHGLADALDHGDIDGIRLLGLDDECIAGHVSREGRRGVADGDLGSGLPDFA